jgi:hypothetical protein
MPKSRELTVGEEILEGKKRNAATKGYKKRISGRESQ